MNLLSMKKTIKSELQGLYPAEEIHAMMKVMLGNYLDFTPTDILTKEEIEINPKLEKQIINALRRLKKNEPLQYILGKTEFYGLQFTVNPAVLIPRNETEELVHWILSENRIENPSILDIGTGSGCIAISLKKNLPKAKVTAIDISEKALETAISNAKINNTDIQFLNGDILDAKEFPNDNFEIIVSNPPYVRHSEKKQMNSNVVNYEPHTALFVEDSDPLIFYRAIAEFAKAHVKENGRIFLEINEALAGETSTILKENGFNAIIVKKDINGKQRMIKASK